MSIPSVNRRVYGAAGYAVSVNKKNPDTFGGRVVDLRKQRKMSQTALAAKVGISQPSLSDIENNETTVAHIRAKTLQRLALHLHTNTKYLETGAGSPTAPTGTSLKKIVDIFPNLSEKAKDRLIGYAEALLADESPDPNNKTKERST